MYTLQDKNQDGWTHGTSHYKIIFGGRLKCPVDISADKHTVKKIRLSGIRIV